MTITWDSGNPDPVSYYIIQYRAKGPDSKYETVDSITTTRYSIGGLYPNTEYEIRVSAFNSIGQGPPSARVDARTGEQAPASPPRNVQAHIISQNTVMVRWEEPEEPNGQVGRGSPPLSLQCSVEIPPPPVIPSLASPSKDRRGDLMVKRALPRGPFQSGPPVSESGGQNCAHVGIIEFEE